MKLARKLIRGVVTAGVTVAFLVVSVSTSAAFDPRVPQIAFNSASLQAYLDGIPESINVLTDQVDAQVWTASVSGNSTFTLMIELTGMVGANAIGIYNTNDPPTPPLFQVFPPVASAGWFATAHFQSGNLVVTLFNQNSIIQGQNFYLGVDPNAFGFYIDGPSGTFYSQDARNLGGNAQLLTYAGTGQNAGEWWECFEDAPYAEGDKDFDDAVLLMQSVVPTDIDATTWGKLKTLYRK